MEPVPSSSSRNNPQGASGANGHGNYGQKYHKQTQWLPIIKSYSKHELPVPPLPIQAYFLSIFFEKFGNKWDMIKDSLHINPLSQTQD
jgi:hypothetical protein